ncbi:MAG TPA: hypothetical protein VIP09_10480 [Dehalococcoidia bacterium]|jgi:hypothetical protein
MATSYKETPRRAMRVRMLRQALEAAQGMGMAKVQADCERLLGEVG